jgi:hypothetical protein
MNSIKKNINEGLNVDQLNILIIEADPSILAGMGEKLSDLGFNFCSAKPYSLIEQLAALRADLAILGPSLDQ